MQTTLIILTTLIVITAVLLPHIAFTVVFSHKRRCNDPYRGLVGDNVPPARQQFRRHVDEFVEMKYEDVYIKSYDGLSLHARYYHTKDGAPIQIQFHGYKSFALRDFCWGGMQCIKHGHNLLLVDHRSHGESEGRTITFGIKERYDCLSWARYAVKRFGKEQKIVLLGISMGAATVLMASELPLPKNVCGIVADCPYESPKEIIKKVARDKRFPPRFVYMLSRLGALVFDGFDPGSASAVESVKRAKVPILLIHGEKDGFVPIEMSRRIAEASSLVELHTFPEAEHALSFLTDMERYERTMYGFIERVTKTGAA